MTDRPTPPYPGYLDNVLVNVENGIVGGTVDPKGWEAYLAAEVHALRAELAEARRNLRVALDAGEAAELRIVELRGDRDLMTAEVERMQGTIDSYRAEHDD